MIFGTTNERVITIVFLKVCRRKIRNRSFSFYQALLRHLRNPAENKHPNLDGTGKLKRRRVRGPRKKHKRIMDSAVDADLEQLPLEPIDDGADDISETERF